MVTVGLFCWSTVRPCLCGLAFNSWVLENRHSSTYGWETAQYGPKSGQKLHQTDRSFRKFSRRSFIWYNAKAQILKEKRDFMKKIVHGLVFIHICIYIHTCAYIFAYVAVLFFLSRSFFLCNEQKIALIRLSTSALRAFLFVGNFLRLLF